MFVRNHPFFKLIHGCNITIIRQKGWVTHLLLSEIKRQAKEVSASKHEAETLLALTRSVHCTNSLKNTGIICCLAGQVKWVLVKPCITGTCLILTPHYHSSAIARLDLLGGGGQSRAPKA